MMRIFNFSTEIKVLCGTLFDVNNKAIKEIKNKGNKGKRGKTNEKQ